MQTVSGLSIAFMMISAAVVILGPIILVIVLKIKRKARIVPALIGAATFIVASLIIEGTINSLVFSAAGTFLRSNPWLYALYGGLMAGLFEESGRFASFKLIRKKYNTTNDVLSFGAGYGGIESILIAGLGIISSLVLISMVNSGQINGVISALPATQQQALSASVSAMVATPPVDFLAGGVERISAISFHMGASILVYLAAVRKLSFWYYPLAVLLHVILDIPAALFQVQPWTSTWVLEAIVFIIAAAVLTFALLRLKAADKNAAALAEGSV